MSCAQVLTAFLLSPAHHEQLLPLLRRWPPQLYSVPALTEATLHRCAVESPNCSAALVRHVTGASGLALPVTG